MKRFISIEGCDGAGKGTIIRKLLEHLYNKDIKHYVSREPGGNAISEKIRSIILDPKNTLMCKEAEAYLYAASRAQHVQETIIPKVNDGYFFVTDRFVDSSLVYQGVSRGLGIDEVLELNQLALNGIMPDLTIYLDVDPAISLERIGNRSDDRLDSESLKFHKKTREGYLTLLERFDRIKLVDASQSKEDVIKDAIKVLDDYLDEIGDDLYYV